MPDKDSPYSIGTDHCPGLGKLLEEMGECTQVVGKIIGFGGMGHHWDGNEKDLKTRLEEELADLIASVYFVAKENDLDRELIDERSGRKLQLFRQWHAEQKGTPAG